MPPGLGFKREEKRTWDIVGGVLLLLLGFADEVFVFLFVNPSNLAVPTPEYVNSDEKALEI